MIDWLDNDSIYKVLPYLANTDGKHEASIQYDRHSIEIADKIKLSTTLGYGGIVFSILHSVFQCLI